MNPEIPRLTVGFGDAMVRTLALGAGDASAIGILTALTRPSS